MSYCKPLQRIWRGRVPALVNPDLKPILNLHLNLHMKKKVHLKVHVKHDYHVYLDFQVKVQLNLQVNLFLRMKIHQNHEPKVQLKVHRKVHKSWDPSCLRSTTEPNHNFDRDYNQLKASTGWPHAVPMTKPQCTNVWGTLFRWPSRSALMVREHCSDDLAAAHYWLTHAVLMVGLLPTTEPNRIFYWDNNRSKARSGWSHALGLSQGWI